MKRTDSGRRPNVTLHHVIQQPLNTTEECQRENQSQNTESDPNHEGGNHRAMTQNAGPLASLDWNSPMSSPRVNGRRSLVNRNGFRKIVDKPCCDVQTGKRTSLDCCDRIPIRTRPETIKSGRTVSVTEGRSNTTSSTDDGTFAAATQEYRKEGNAKLMDITNPQRFSEFQTADILRIFVDDYSSARYFNLLDTLQKNQVVEKIVIFRKRQSDGFRTRRQADLDHLFHTLHTLSRTLNELNFWNFRLQDLTSLSLGLYDHQSIQYLQLHMESDTLDEETLKTFAALPNLISLEIEVNASFPVWRLLESKSLAVLSIVSNHFVFESTDILPMADKLETNSVLQVLDIEPRLPAWCLGVIMTSIHSSVNSMLDTFQFSCRACNKKDGDNTVMDILRTITSHKSKLRVVWNHCYEGFLVSDDIERTVLLGLQSSKSVEQFHVFVESEGFSLQKCRIMEHRFEGKGDS